MDDLVFSLILLGAAMSASAVVYFAVVFVIKRWHRVPFLGGVDIKLEWFKGPLRLLFPLVSVASVLSFLRLPPEVHAMLFHTLNLLLIGVFSWLIMRIIHLVRDIVLNRYDISAKDNLRARRVYTQIRVVEHILTAVVILLAVSFMLMSFPRVRQMGVSLLASAGIIGIILGFAAQKTLGNLVAGIQIAISQPIRLDDVVIVENEWGWIEEINLIYVVVRIWDLRRLIVPISYFIEHPFESWTRTSADILGTVFLYADYTVPVKEVRKELTRILKGSSYWDGKVDVLQVTNATERTIELRALMSAVDSPLAWNLRCEVREKLLDFLQKNYPESLPKTRIEMEKTSQEGNPNKK
jgi:small-conductance mechanosensitive channel